MKSFRVEKEIKLSKFLLDNYKGELSYSVFQKLLRQKDVKINGKRVNKDVKLLPQDEVVVYYDSKPNELSVYLNESGVLVLDKKSGITSEDFEAQVNAVYSGAKLCHRLDRNTSGLIVFATDDTAYNELLKAFKTRTINKEYVCEVYGKMDAKSKTLTAYLKKDAENSKVYIYDKKVDGSQKIVTEYAVIKEGINSSLLTVKLITGKTHQIRAHLAHNGNFIIGDGKYGINAVNEKFGAKTQRLTAYKLTFNFDKDSPLYSLNERKIELKREYF